MTTRRPKLPAPISPELQRALTLFADDSIIVMSGLASFTSNPSFSGTGKPEPLPTARCIDRWKLADILKRHARTYPLDLAELMVAVLIAEKTRRAPGTLERFVHDVVNRRAQELLVACPMALNPQVLVPYGEDIGCLQPFYIRLLESGIGLDAEKLSCLLGQPGSEHLAAMLQQVTPRLEAERDDIGSSLAALRYMFGSMADASTLRALFELGLPVSVLGVPRLNELGAMAGKAAAHSESSYQKAIKLLDCLVEKVGGRFERQVMMSEPIQETLSAVDTAWASAKSAHPVYAMYYAMSTESSTVMRPRDTVDFPSRPLREITERLNALMTADSRLRLEDIPPVELLKLSVLCTKASDHGTSHLFWAGNQPFTGGRRNNPDDVLRYVAQEHVGRGARLLPEDLRAGGDEQRMRAQLGDERFLILEKFAMENVMRARIEAVQAGAAAENAPRRRRTV